MTGQQPWNMVYVSELRLVCLNTVFLFHRTSSKIQTLAESRKSVSQNHSIILVGKDL